MITDGITTIAEMRRVLDGCVYTYRLKVNESFKYSSVGIPLYSIEIHMLDCGSGKTSEEIGRAHV